MDRFARAFSILACAGLLAGCGGGGGGGGGDLEDTLGYLPEDTGLVVVVTTDLEGDQLQRLDRKIVRPTTEGRTVEGLLRIAAASVQLSWEDDVKPLLGNPLVIGTQSASGPFGEARGITVAIDTGDGGKLREVLEKVPEVERTGEESGADVYAGPEGLMLAVEGDTLVLAEDRETLVQALEQHDSSGRLTSAGLNEALPDDGGNALVQARISIATVLRAGFSEETLKLRAVPWFAALRTVGLLASFPDDDHLTVDLALNTEEVGEDDLPVASGEEAPEIVRREREIAGANRDQSRTTVFLLRAARAVFPDSRFIQAVDDIERDLGIDFEDEILRQFNGPSVSSLSFDGQAFAARSEVQDPDRLREQLKVLAPRLPELVQGLDGLRSQGLALLLLFAPDAPVTTMALGQVNVETPSDEDELYHVAGLEGDGPSDLYFGLVGDVFVVGSDEERARAIAEADTEPVEGARGAAVTRFDAREGTSVLLDRFGLSAAEIVVGEVVGTLEASATRVRATLRAELP